MFGEARQRLRRQSLENIGEAYQGLSRTVKDCRGLSRIVWGIKVKYGGYFYFYVHFRRAWCYCSFSLFVFCFHILSCILRGICVGFSGHVFSILLFFEGTGFCYIVMSYSTLG